MRNLVQSTLDGIANPYMAESDSQSNEAEDPESLDIDPLVPVENDREEEGSGLDPSDAQNAEGIEMKEAETFNEGVSDMLDSIGIDEESDEYETIDDDDSGPIIDELLGEQESQVEEPEAEEPEAAEDADAIEEEIAEAFADEDDDSTNAGDPLPTPEELLVQAGKVLNGSETPIPEPEEAASEESEAEPMEGIGAMPDPQSLMKAAAEDNDGREDEKPEPSSSEKEESLESKLPSPDDVLAQAAAALDSEDSVETDSENAGIAAMPDPQALISEALGSEEPADGWESKDAEVESAGGEEAGDSDGESGLSSPDDVLKHAASVLNDAPLSEDGEEESPADADDAMTMPDPQSLIQEAASDESDAEEEDIEVMAMPDPQALIQSADENPGEAPDLPEKKENVGSNIADRAGNLPPPPPAPVALDDDEIYVEEEPEPEEEPELEEDAAAATPAVKAEGSESTESADSGDEEEDMSLLMDDEDLLTGDASLEGFNVGLDDANETENLVQFGNSEEGNDSRRNSGLGPWEKLIRSTALAAGLAVAGIGISLFALKQEIYDYFLNGSLESSILSQRIVSVAELVFDELGEARHFEAQELDSELQWISDREAIVEVTTRAILTRDLYKVVGDEVVYSQLDFDREQIDQAQAFVAKRYPESELIAPAQPWERLVNRSARKGEAFPLVTRFRLKRSSEEDTEEWELFDLSVVGDDSDSIWGRGDALKPHSEGVKDIASLDFKYHLRSYQSEGIAYLDQVERLRERYALETQQRQKELDAWRGRLAASLSEGVYYRGMAIAGEDAVDAQEISLLITETRHGESLIKGVMQLGGDRSQSKHFTGILDYVDKGEGEVQGLLNLTTIAFADQPRSQAPLFFQPGTVSRISLRTDGTRMEGDGDDISLRLIRSL